MSWLNELFPGERGPPELKLEGGNWTFMWFHSLPRAPVDLPWLNRWTVCCPKQLGEFCVICGMKWECFGIKRGYPTCESLAEGGLPTSTCGNPIGPFCLYSNNIEISQEQWRKHLNKKNKSSALICLRYLNAMVHIHLYNLLLILGCINYVEYKCKTLTFSRGKRAHI